MHEDRAMFFKVRNYILVYHKTLFFQCSQKPICSPPGSHDVRINWLDRAAKVPQLPDAVIKKIVDICLQYHLDDDDNSILRHYYYGRQCKELMIVSKTFYVSPWKTSLLQ